MQVNGARNKLRSMWECYDKFYKEEYLPRHSKVTNRVGHYIGTTSGVVAGVSTACTDYWELALPIAFGVTYSILLPSHRFLERNTAATIVGIKKLFNGNGREFLEGLKFTLLSIPSDLRMCVDAATFKLKPKLQELNLDPANNPNDLKEQG